MYSPKTIQYFNNQKNYGRIKNPDGIGKVGNIVCGSFLFLSESSRYARSVELVRRVPPPPSLPRWGDAGQGGGRRPPLLPNRRPGGTSPAAARSGPLNTEHPASRSSHTFNSLPQYGSSQGRSASSKRSKHARIAAGVTLAALHGSMRQA